VEGIKAEMKFDKQLWRVLWQVTAIDLKKNNKIEQVQIIIIPHFALMAT